MSAKTGRAPTNSAQLAEATKLIGVVSISSPGPSPAAAAAPCSAAVPLAEGHGMARLHVLGDRLLKALHAGALGDERIAHAQQATASTSAGSIVCRP